MINYDGRYQGHAFHIELDGFRFKVLFVPDTRSKEIGERLTWVCDRATGREYEGPINPKAILGLGQTLYWTCQIDSATMIGLASLKAACDAACLPRYIE